MSWKLGDIVTAHYAGIQADCKITEVMLSAREGDAIYRTAATFEVLTTEGPASGTVLAGADGSAQFWRSIDLGLTWAMTQETGDEFHYFGALTDTADGEAVAGISNFAGNGEFWKSDDDGSRWLEKDIAAGVTRILCMLRTLSDALVAGTGFGAGDAQFWRSTDDGESWEYIDTAGTEDDVLCMAMAADGTLYAGTTDFGSGLGECWRSTDHGATWVKRSNTGLGVYSIAVAANGYVVIGLYLGAIRYSSNGGTTWTTATGTPGGVIPWSMLVLSNGDILTGYSDGRIYRSTNNGVTWWLDTTFPCSGDIYALCQVSESIVIAAVDARLYRSTDLGVSWIEVHDASDDGVIFKALVAPGVEL